MAGIVEGLHDGYPTTISLTGAGTTFWEVEVQPPGFDGGEPLDLTTMRNSTIRTAAPRHLYSVTPMNGSCAYDPTVVDTVKAQINVNQQIVTTMPDGATITWWGYLKSFVPEPCREGQPPRASFTLVHTGRNNSGAETVPVVTEGSGTGA